MIPRKIYQSDKILINRRYIYKNVVKLYPNL